jgi:hypothetical protein
MEKYEEKKLFNMKLERLINKRKGQKKYKKLYEMLSWYWWIEECSKMQRLESGKSKPRKVGEIFLLLVLLDPK